MTGGRRPAVAVAITLLVLTSATVGFVGTAGAATAHVLGGQSIEGALEVTVEDGNVAVGRYDGSSFVDQYYSHDSSDTVLYVDGTIYDLPGGGTADGSGIELVVAQQYLTDGGTTVVTEFAEAGGTGLLLTQRVSYSAGNEHFDLTWHVTNTGSESARNLRLLNGKDTYLAGGDYGEGFWNADLATIGVTKTVSGEQQRLQMTGINAPSAHQSDAYGSVWDSLQAGALTNDVDTSTHDNAYALEWRRSGLGAGETWTVKAREGFTQGSIVVTGPGTTTLPGGSADLDFELTNVGEGTETVTLTAGSPSGWTLSAPSEVTIGTGESVIVTVDVTVPESTTPGLYDVSLAATTEGSSDTATAVIEYVGGEANDETSPSGGPSFRVTDRSIDDTAVYVGETVTTTAVVENRGSAAGTYRAVLNDGSGTRFADALRIGGGSSHTFRIPLRFDEAGSYSLRFSDQFVDRVEVEERPPGPLDDADVAVLDATVPRSTVWAGGSYRVTAVVENVGTETGVASVAFATGDDGPNSTAIERTETVTLAPGGTADLIHRATVDADADERVTRTWTVNGVLAGNVTVLPVDSLETGVVDAYAEPTSVAPGEAYDVVAVVHNADDDRRSISVNFAEQDGELGSLRFVSVGTGETRTVARTVSATEDAAGTSIHWWINGLETAVDVGSAD